MYIVIYVINIKSQFDKKYKIQCHQIDCTGLKPKSKIFYLVYALRIITIVVGSKDVFIQLF